MHLRTHFGPCLILAATSITFGCGDDAKDTSDAATDTTREDAALADPAETMDASALDMISEEVGTRGARLTLDTLVLIIPPGAIAEQQVITLRVNAEDSNVPSAPYSKRYDIEPAELTLTLAATVELRVSDRPKYPVLVVHVPGQAATLIAGEVNSGKFTAPIDHFGSIYLADAAELAQSDEFANDAIVIGLVGKSTDAGPDGGAETSNVEADAGVTEDADADVVAPDATVQSDAGTATVDAGVVDASSAKDAANVEPLEPGAVPPQGYLTSQTGPFASVAFDYFYLEDFEDHELNQPGVTASAFQLSSSFTASIIDSVDGDDGNPSDNQCMKLDAYCDALWAAGSVTFTFNADELGGYPTHAGAVWTDGEGMVGFEAYGLQGEVIYAIEPFSEPGFPGTGVTSDTAEDRFFGVYSPTGVTGIRLHNTSGGIEVDHLQYGREQALD